MLANLKTSSRVIVVKEFNVKPEQVVRVQKQRTVVHSEQDKLSTILEEEPETPVDFERLSSEQKYDLIFETLLQLIPEKRQRGDDIEAFTPVVPIPYQVDGKDIGLHLRFGIVKSHWQDELSSEWFTYDFNDGLARHHEKLKRTDIEDPAARPETSPFGDRMRRELNNFQWSVESYLEAVKTMTAEELQRRRFPESYIADAVSSSTTA